jgi:glycosyltransferase involved in cell wall biosynthesis
MRKIIYIGEFPPAYNGVSIKNSLVAREILNERKLKIIDMVECKRQPWKIPFVALQVFAGLLVNCKIVLGMGTFRRLEIIFLRKALRGKRALKDVNIMVMGREFHRQVIKYKRWRKVLPYLGPIWVESEKMQDVLIKAKAKSVFVFPNCRSARNARPPQRNTGRLKCVFFSNIYPDKGVDIIRKSIPLLNQEAIDFSVDFYGTIYEDYRTRFEEFIAMDEKVRYCGVFDAVTGDVYGLLNQYDVLLLPTYWQGEGVPGVLVESKMAGITTIVSDWNYNSEVVRNGIEGIVMSSNTPESLCKAIIELANNRELLFSLKEGAYLSAKQYDVKTYKEKILSIL